MPEPKHNRGKSKQDYRTPVPFLIAVRRHLGVEEFDCDLAASIDNAVCPLYYAGPDSRFPKRSAFANPWKLGDGWNWCNPPFGNIKSWVQRANEEMFTHNAQTCMLLPAGASTEWFNTYVHNQAFVMFVRPRLTFVGCDDAYPKDLMLLLYSPWLESGYTTWRWDDV